MATRSLIVVCLLCTAAMTVNAGVNAKVSVTQAEWASCGKNPGIKLSLQVEMENSSQERVVLGRVNVAQERLYREGEQGKLELAGTSATPDEFTSNLTNPYEEIEEKALSGHTRKTFTIMHYAYVSESFVQWDGNVGRIIASFHVTNVRRDGRMFSYWSHPVAIILPQKCELY